MSAFLLRVLLAGTVASAILLPFEIRACRFQSPDWVSFCGEFFGLQLIVWFGALTFAWMTLAYLPWRVGRKWLIARQVRPMFLALSYPALGILVFGLQFVWNYQSFSIAIARADPQSSAYFKIYESLHFANWAQAWPISFALVSFFLIMDSEE